MTIFWFYCKHSWSVLPWCWRTTSHSRAAWPRRYNTAARGRQTPTDPTLPRLLPSTTNRLEEQNIKLLAWICHLTLNNVNVQKTRDSYNHEPGTTCQRPGPLRVLKMISVAIFIHLLTKTPKVKPVTALFGPQDRNEWLSHLLNQRMRKGKLF